MKRCDVLLGGEFVHRSVSWSIDVTEQGCKTRFGSRVQGCSCKAKGVGI